MFNKTIFGWEFEINKPLWNFCIKLYKPTYVWDYGEGKEREWYFCPFQLKMRNDYYDIGFNFAILNLHIDFCYYKRDLNVSYLEEALDEILHEIPSNN